MPVTLDLTNQRYNRLVAKTRLSERSDCGHVQWSCLCDCGNEVVVVVGALRSGNTKSCGCLNRETTIQRNKDAATHGMSRTPVYQAWNAMIQRCENINDSHYPDYGARGITVCESWKTFENFYADMGDKPSDAHSIDRVRNGEGYSPSNCCWATATEQANNRRSNRLLVFNGEEMTASVLAKRYGINVQTFYYRLDAGWTVEDAINKPLKGKG